MPRFLQEGHHVTVLDSFLYQQTPFLDLCHHPRFNIMRGDARDKALVARLMKNADVILPLACLTGAPICDRDPWAAHSVNFEAVKMLVEQRSSLHQMIIFPNTNSGYGMGEKNLHCHEETPLRPVSLYGRLKVELEDFVLAQENTMSFRLATVFGMSPRMRLDLMVNDFVYRAVRDGYLIVFEGEFKRNFIHVRDVAKVFLHGLNHFEAMHGQAYNVGLSNANLSKIELCQKIQSYVPKFCFEEKKIGKDPDQRNYIVSNLKIEKTGYLPDFSLDDGIQELLKGYQIIDSHHFRNV